MRSSKQRNVFGHATAEEENELIENDNIISVFRGDTRRHREKHLTPPSVSDKSVFRGGSL